MGGENRWQGIALPPVNTEMEEEQWRNFNNSVNAVSLGFVATAILISMFLVMAIFERFFRPRSSQLTTSARTAATTHLDLQAQITNNDSKLDRHNSHKVSFFIFFSSPLVVITAQTWVSTVEQGRVPSFFTAKLQITLLHAAFESLKLKATNHARKMRNYAREVSVMMPGEDMPTFIAHPAPAPCLPERIAWPLHQHKPCL
ncbi:uncharacterized protein [Pyrus communis]|uniref:uncharacterized protein n=1 Tax=Pyrus communis TaxID=23211 RepID=UPI0035BEBA1A